MSLNFSIAGNSCFCFSQSKNATLSDDEEEEYPKVVNTMGDVAIKHAVLTREVMETAIRPTSHLGKAVENVSVGLRDRISQGKSKETKAMELRQKRLADIEERVFKEAVEEKPLLLSPDRPDPPRETLGPLDPFDPFEPLKKKKSRWWKISKKPKKIPEGKLINLDSTLKVSKKKGHI